MRGPRVNRKPSSWTAPDVECEANGRFKRVHVNFRRGNDDGELTRELLAHDTGTDGKPVMAASGDDAYAMDVSDEAQVRAAFDKVVTLR